MGAGTRRVERRSPRTPLPGLPALLARVLGARVGTADEVACDWERLIPPDRLAGMDQAVALLAHALAARQKIIVVADFDADGATSCAVAVRALRAFGAAVVDYLVPNRFEYGYGLTPEIVDLAATRAPALLVTVDQGITSIEGVARARALGMAVLVTDHHLPGAALPEADAIVNPNQPGDQSGAGALAGVGVIFYVMLALRAHLRAGGWFADQGIPEPNLGLLMDLVALGTVADVVPLDRNNRILVRDGLRRINAGRACPGIRALLSVARRSAGRLAAADLAFAVAPRLNAAGRITDMSVGIDCLLSDQFEEARLRAAALDQLNQERRAIEERMSAEALTLLGALEQTLEGDLPWGLCVFQDSWHQGVIGILAGRLKDRFYRPTVAFADAGDGWLKGSARSVPGLHIRDVFQEIAARHPGLLSRFGGHAMAAGLTLARADLATFAEAFDAHVRAHLTPADLERVAWSDGPLGPDELREETVALLQGAGPYGQSFPEPVFDNCFELVEQRVVGERHLKLRLRPEGGGPVVEAIAFGCAPWAGGPLLQVLYRLDLNEYQGSCSLQLVVEHLQPVSRPASNAVS